MSTEWIRRKRANFPHGTLEKFLKFDQSKNLLEAFKNRNPKTPEPGPKVIPLERMSDDQLALAFAGYVIKAMHLGGVRRAEREAD